MSEPMTMVAMAGFGLTALGIMLFAALKGWQGWLDLKRLELPERNGPPGEPRRNGRADRGGRFEGTDPQAREPRGLHRPLNSSPAFRGRGGAHREAVGGEGLAESGEQTLTLPLRGPLPLP